MDSRKKGWNSEGRIKPRRDSLKKRRKTNYHELS